VADELPDSHRMTPAAPRCRPDGFRTRHAAARRAWQIAATSGKRVEPVQCGDHWHLAAQDAETTDTRTGDRS
jgi:hypothetical protein